MTTNRTALLLVLGSFCLPATLEAAGANPKTAPAVIAAAEKEGQLTVYATTDQVVAGPLVKDFQALYPKIKVTADMVKGRVALITYGNIFERNHVIAQ